MGKIELEREKEDLSIVYSTRSPLELVDEYNAYRADNDFGDLYDVLMNELSLRAKKDKPEDWVEKVKESEEFLNQSNQLGLNPEKIYDNISEKGDLLKKVKKYTVLRGNSRSIDDLIEINDPKIGIVFQTVYVSAQKRLKEI